jgi:ABC-type polysaccharide/polyol phosphate export permease
MEVIKKYLGVIWMLIGPVAMFVFVKQVLKVIEISDNKIANAVGETAIEVAKADKSNLLLQWSILLFVFGIIAIGFMIFGYYALIGQYAKKQNT